LGLPAQVRGTGILPVRPTGVPPVEMQQGQDAPRSVLRTATHGRDAHATADAHATPEVVTVAPGQVQRTFVRVRAEAPGMGSLTLDARTADFADSIRRSIRIVPPGRPAATSVSGTLADGRQVIDVPLPAGAEPGSIALQFKVYPSTFSQVVDGLENIFRMPSGCFEQTSSTTYPNVMALAYLKANRLDNPELSAKATRYIQLGCQRLVGFEVAGGGFDWFGRPPANVVLTAYGLMEFCDMAKVYAVDAKLLERTAAFLAGQQDGSGAWHTRAGCFHEPFTGPDSGALAATAYVTRAMAMHPSGLAAARRGAGYIESHLSEAGHPHTLALAAGALLAVDASSPAGRDLQRRLAESAQRDDKGLPYWTDVSATALAVLALSSEPQYAALTRDASAWLIKHKDPGGTWGTTHATVLTLKALLAGKDAPTRRTAAAEIRIAADSRGTAVPAVRTTGVPPVEIQQGQDAPATHGRDAHATGVTLLIPADQSDMVHAMRVPAGAGAGGAGAMASKLIVDARNAAGLGYQVVVNYYTTDRAGTGTAAGIGAAERAQPPVSIEVAYDRTGLAVGETVAVRATLTNRTDATVHMVMADVGVPPGFGVDGAELDKARSAGRIERYTLTARGVIIYLNRLDARGRLELGFRMKARMMLKAQAAPSTAYPYYEPHRLSAAAPMAVEVVTR